MRRPERRRRSKVLASGTFNGEINLWDIDKQKEIASFSNERRSVYGLALSADRKKPLSSCGADVILKDTVKGMPLGRFMGNKGSASRVAFAPDEKLVVAQAIQFMVWDARTFEHLPAFDHSPVFSLAITPDSKNLLSCDAKGNIKLYEMPRR